MTPVFSANFDSSIPPIGLIAWSRSPPAMASTSAAICSIGR
jgi:hypothetical protein